MKVVKIKWAPDYYMGGSVIVTLDRYLDGCLTISRCANLDMLFFCATWLNESLYSPTVEP